MIARVQRSRWPRVLALSVGLAIPLVTGCNKGTDSTTTNANNEVQTTAVEENQQMGESDAKISTEQTNSADSSSSQSSKRVDPGGRQSPVGPDEPMSNRTKDATGDTSGGGDQHSKRQSVSTRTSGGSHQKARGAPQAKDPNAAKKLGSQLLAKATKAADKGNMGQAFQAAVQAWETTRNFVDDPECQTIAANALKQTEEYGEAANRDSGKANDRNRVTIQ